MCSGMGQQRTVIIFFINDDFLINEYDDDDDDDDQQIVGRVSYPFELSSGLAVAGFPTLPSEIIMSEN